MTEQQEKKLDELIVKTYGPVRITDSVRDQSTWLLKRKDRNFSTKDVKLDRKFNDL